MERALALARETGTHLLHAYMSPLALVYWRSGRRDDAFDHVEQCLAITQRANERMIEAGVRDTFGELLRLDGGYAGALDQHRAALAVARAGGTPHDEARAYTGLGDTRAHLGDQDAARAEWRRALEIFARLGRADADLVRKRLP